MQDRSGQVALITGGGSGIGLATGRHLRTRGATVLVADVDAARGEDAAAELDGRFLHLDVADPAAWDRALAGVDRLHVVHLNAGVASPTPDVTAFTDEQYRRIMGVNVDGVAFGLRATVPLLRAAGGGAIVVTASLGGLVPMATDPLYSATKHAVVALARSAAPQLEPLGITCNAVCPGFADTPLVTAEHRTTISALGVPLIRAEDVADAVLAIIDGGATGEAWFVQPGRPAAPYRFGGVPGPRPVDVG